MLFAARSAASHFCRFLISLGSIKIFIQGAGEKVRESEKFYAVVERRGTERGGEGEEGAVLRVARVPLPIHLDISFTSERPERYEFDGRLSRMDSFSAIKKVGKKKKERKKGRNGGQREGGRKAESIVEFVQRFARRGFTVPGTRRPPGLSSGLSSPVSGCRTFYDTRRLPINRGTRTDLYIDIGALKYTNVPLIGLSPPVRTIKAALHSPPKSPLTAAPFKLEIWPLNVATVRTGGGEISFPLAEV